MEKTIARLEVIVNDDPKCQVSGLVSQSNGIGNLTGNYKIVLCPNAGKIERAGIIDIFAHELGHFVAQVFKLPEHVQDNWQGWLGIDGPKLPSELQAWDIGEKIRPGVKRSPAYRMGIESYRKHDSML